MKGLFVIVCFFLLAVSAIDRKHQKHTFKSNKISQSSRHSQKQTSKSAECDALNYNDWKQVGTLRPADSLIHGFMGSTLGSIAYQKITDGLGPVNLDLYEVTIDTMPTTFATGKELFEFWRRDLAKGDATQFVDKDQCSFKAFDDGEATRWGSDNPLTTYVTIHLARLIASITSFSFDDGSVMCSEFESGEDHGHWVFTVISSLRDGQHPVSGNRRFGWYKKEGKVTFYTKGVDRVTTVIDRIASAAGQVFENADLTWISMQNKLIEYVNANGGSAPTPPPPRLSVRCDWDAVWGSWTELCDSRGVIETDGGCHTTNTISCDDNATCEPTGDNPCPTGGCVCGTLSCYCGRAPEGDKICDPWRTS